MAKRQLKIGKYDILGVVASVACMIHCLLPPLLMGVVAMGGTFGIGFLDHALEGEHEHYTHFIFIGLAWLSVYYSNKSNTSKSIQILMYVAVAGFSLFVMLHEVWESSLYVSLMFSAFLVVLHGMKLSKYYRSSKLVEGASC